MNSHRKEIALTRLNMKTTTTMTGGRIRSSNGNVNKSSFKKSRGFANNNNKNDSASNRNSNGYNKKGLRNSKNKSG